MSNFDKERPSISGDHSDGGGGGEDDDNDDDVCRGNCGVNRKQRGHRYKMDFRRAKQVVISPFRKAKKHQLHLPNGNIASSGSGAAVATTKASRGGKRMIGCCLCLKQPMTLESPLDSHTSDPNNPDVFSYECLKSLVENNDFYSKQCNPHCSD